MDKKVIVFCRSKEMNGINEIKRALAKCKEFIITETAFELLREILWRRRASSVLCLSSTDSVICDALLNTFKIRVPIVMCVYHPKQWLYMTNERRSSVLRKAFLAHIRGMPLKNIIFNTQAAYEASMNIHSMSGKPNLIVAPTRIPEIIDCDFRLDRKEGVEYIATLGRLVDFKVSSILAMIEVARAINECGKYRVEYHIFGDGPSRETILNAIGDGAATEYVKFHGILPPREFGGTIQQFDVYFGMGFTVVHAAMLKVPALIAIQGQQNPTCYGWFCDYDHRKIPMFGDPIIGFPEVPFRNLLESHFDAMPADRAILGRRCAESASAYDYDETVKKIRDVCEDADILATNTSIYDLIWVRLQTWRSRFNKADQMHV